MCTVNDYFGPMRHMLYSNFQPAGNPKVTLPVGDSGSHLIHGSLGPLETIIQTIGLLDLFIRFRRAHGRDQHIDAASSTFFTKNTPYFPLFLQKPPPFSTFFYKKHPPPFYFLPTGLYAMRPTTTETKRIGYTQYSYHCSMTITHWSYCIGLRGRRHHRSLHRLSEQGRI